MTSKKNFTVEYNRTGQQTWYMADFKYTAKSDFTIIKFQAMPMTREHADQKAELGNVMGGNGLTAKVVSL